MNEVIINNWNSTVGDSETIYHLGDWTFGWGHKPINYWKRQLKGNIVSIRGSHDPGRSGIQFQDFEEIHINGYDFLLIHSPNPTDKHQTQEQKQKLENWHGWIIHGHVHDKASFIDGQKKRINVGVEVIDYKPVSLKYLLSLGLDSIRRMRTIDSQPDRW
jgi:calcineurin-like phosphoesterase family protein